MTASDLGPRHARPLEHPNAKGFIERLPLTNPDLGTVKPTPARLIPCRDGYWLASGSDLYKLSTSGQIQEHVVYPYSYDIPISLMLWSALAPRNSGGFYALGSNVASFDPFASLLLFDDNGEVLRRWQIVRELGYGQMIASSDAVYYMDSLLLIIDNSGQFKHRLNFMENLYSVSLTAMSEDSSGNIWLGANGSRDTIDCRLFEIGSEGQVGPAYALRPRFTYAMPEAFGQIQDMSPLPNGGWIIAGFMAYFDHDNPWEERWKYFSYLAEIGADGAVHWAQMYRDMDIIGIQRNTDGHIWAYGYLERTSNILEKAVVMHFSPQGEPEWAVERVEGIYDWVLSDTLALAPGGGLAMGWTQGGHQELRFGILKPSQIQEGCDAILPAEIADRWLGPVEIDVRPITIEPVEMAPVEIWEEPVELWEGEGQASERCVLEGLPPSKKLGLP